MLQNIQKKLLLYVLQKLSFFSQINLPNLEEVSLNNFVLKDVLIDPEKVGKLPGCNFRFGKISTLQLTTISGISGVLIEANNVEIVISPDFDINEDIANSLSFSIAQSTADLANTIILDDDDLENDDNEDEVVKQSSRKNSTSSQRPSALGGVMQKAVELALSRLQIKINNLKVKIVSELTDLSLEIDEIKINTSNGTRNVTVERINIRTLKPNISGGDQEEEEEEEDLDNDINDDNYGDESLMNSMVFTHEEASSIYMSATSQSFSKTNLQSQNQELDNKSEESKVEPPIIFHLNRCEIEFDGLSDVKNLEIEVDIMKIAFTPLTPTITSLFNVITKNLKIKNCQKKTNKQCNEKFLQYVNDDEYESLSDSSQDSVDEEEPFFSKLKINQLVISTTSALNEQGEFTSKDTINITFSNVNIKQKQELLLFGGVELFEIVRVNKGSFSRVFYFDSSSNINSSNKADLRFEIFKKSEDESTEITLLLAKSAKFELDIHSWIIISSFISNLLQIQNEFNKLKSAFGVLSKEKNKNQAHTQFILQTASIIIDTKISQSLSLQLTIFPIKYNHSQSQLAINKVLVNCINSSSNLTVMTISDIRVITEISEFKTHLQNHSISAPPRLVTMSTKLLISLQKILIDIPLKQLKLIIQEVKTFVDQFSQTSTQFGGSLERKQNLDTSSFIKPLNVHRGGRKIGFSGLNSGFLNLNKINLVDYLIQIKSIHVEISNVLPRFGSLNLILSDISIFNYKMEVLASIWSMEVTRRKDEFIEQILYQYQNLPIQEYQNPIIFIKCKLREKVNSIEIIARNFLFEYKVNWLNLLNKDESLIDTVEEEIEKVTPTNSSSCSSRFDIRYILDDCMIGLTPGRLNCKSVIIMNKGNIDFTFGINQFYAKSSFRNIRVLLIDDLRNINWKTDASISNQNIPKLTNPVEYYLNQGFAQIGSINLTHIGITFNTEIEESRKRNELLGIKDNLSIIDIKINSDEHQFDLCADSTNTLLQLINDLKLPLNFKDSDKMIIEPKKIISPLKKIEHNIFEDLIEGFTELTVDEDGIPSEISSEASINIVEEHFNQETSGEQNTDPIRLNINLSKAKIYLYDGYDWKETRKTIRKAVKKFEVDHEKMSNEMFEETLYKSIHINAPRDVSPNDLTKSINFDLQQEEDEEGGENQEQYKAYKSLKLRRSSYHKLLIDLKNIETNVTVYSTRDPRKNNTDSTLTQELLNLVELRLGTIDIYDNLTNSTWNKFLGYMNILGEREIGTNMLKLSILNVRPEPSLVSSESIMNVSLLPLRLHIDQDTLEFMTKFFEFKDSRFELPPDEILYLQKFEMNAIKLKIDYKPKKIDYIGLRSGKSVEFANIFTLDGSKITLPKVKLYGMLGFGKLGHNLGMEYLPIFQSTQIIGIISGLSPLRSVVNIGGGFKDLVAIPINEYSKDGRFWRSVQKGTSSFAKTTGYELLNLGVKLASGTQVLLEQGEEMFGGKGSSARVKHIRRYSSEEEEDIANNAIENSQQNLLLNSQLLSKKSSTYNNEHSNTQTYSNLEIDEDDYAHHEQYLLNKSIFLLPSESQSALNTEDLNEEEIEEKLISLYSNQPENIKQGLQSAYKSINTNLMVTIQQLKKLKKEIDKSETVQDSIITIVKNSPVILIRPMIGTTEALSKTLMGLSNKIDSKHMVENRDKYRNDNE